jgi:2-oxoglutarate dehydrogenase E2 component (dihydrolipoamide succinyltransferase)
MGESITEGTLTKWLKKVGDTVQRDEPLFEISTDKVDAEIPSPAAGTLTEIKVAEGATVQINTVVAIIGDGAGAAAPAPAAAAAPSQVSEARPGAPSAPAAATPAPAPVATPAPSAPSSMGNVERSTDNAAGTEIPMPQMGESITEGTITKWLKQVGETVQRDEPLFEISTDKVDAEIPSPVAGVLTEIKVPEGATVGVNTVVAVIGGTGARPAVAAPKAAAPTPAAPAAKAPTPATPAAAPAPPAGERLRSSPLVRKIAKDNNVDLAQVPGTGSAGRITKADILSHMEKPAGASPTQVSEARPGAPAAAKP